MPPATLELSKIPAAPVMRENLSYAADLGSLLAELHMIATAVEQARMSEVGGATRRKMLLRGEDFCYFNEQGKEVAYVEMFATSKKTYSENTTLVERFTSEEMVWKKAGAMASKIAIGDAIGIISPPREIYRFPGQEALSATFILRKVDQEKFEAYSLYVPEIDEIRHKQSVGMPEELSGQSVLETPIWIPGEKLPGVAIALGFAGWEEIKNRALNLDGQQELEKKDVYRAIVGLRQKFAEEKATTFWLGFAEMVRDLLLKDVMGLLAGFGEKEIFQEGVLFLRAKNRGKLNNKLSWVLVGEGIDEQRLEKWMADQRILQQRAVYQAMWGGHGNGSSMLSFGDKNSFLDSRTNLLLKSLKSREKKNDCNKCHKPLNKEGKCEKCGK